VRGEQRKRLFKNKLLRRIFGHEKFSSKEMENENLHIMYFLPNTVITTR
jgi:hypothetical protein